MSNTGLAFSGIEAVSVHGDAAMEPQLRAPRDVPPRALAPFVAVRAPFAGLTLDRPRLMGIVNVTPDSFSDGGDHADPAAAIEHALRLAEDGADIVDIGGE
ncbi:MAG: dihydropteroate synthase, partial [Alphaproteobacteria bacterium]